MNIHAKYFTPVTLLLLTGCTPVSLVMNVDDALQTNATIYSVKYPDSLADKLSGNQLNITFGPYRVTEADTSWEKSNTKAENPQPMFFTEDVKKSGRTTTTTTLSGGPTELMGFSRPAAMGEPSIKNVVQTVSYQFNAGQNLSWQVDCTHKAQKRVTHYDNQSNSELLESNYTCQHTPSDKSRQYKSWILSIEHAGPITMTQQGKTSTFIAESTGGIYIDKDQKPTSHTTAYAGYTWKQINKGKTKKLAAISTREDTPRVWLDKSNSSINKHILSMANAGLLIYGWTINH